jgi:hypothetical protein
MSKAAMADATLQADADPDRASFTIADTVIDLVGTSGGHVLANLIPPTAVCPVDGTRKLVLAEFP